MNTTVDVLEPRDQDSQDDLFQLLGIFLSKKYWIIFVALVFGFFGFAWAMTKTPQFQAEALVLLESKKSGVQFSEDIAEMLSPESEAITEIEILKSRLVLDRVVEALRLDEVAQPVRLPVVGNFLSRYEVPKPEVEWLAGYAWYSEKIVVSDFEYPASWFGSSLEIVKEPSNKFTLITPDQVRMSGEVGELLNEPSSGLKIRITELEGAVGSQYVVKKMIPLEAVNALRSKLTVTEKSRNSGVLRIAMVSENAEKSAAIVAQVVDAYVLQNVGRSAEEAERSLQFLNKQLPNIQTQLRTAESALNDYRLQSETIDLNYEAQTILERAVALDAQLSALSLEETELSRRYTVNHPTYRALLEKKQRILDEKNTLTNSVKNLPATQQEVLSRTRDVEVSQEIYMQLLNKAQELSVMKAGAVGNVRLIDEAAAIPNAVAPKIPLITALAALIGAALSTALVFLRANLSKEIDNPDDLARLSMPVLAVVPYSRQESKRGRYADYNVLSRDYSSELAVEAVRSLRTTLHFSLHDRDRNIVSITGPSPTVGKSFVSSNLAYLAAQAGANVLLIDGDMRRGNLGRCFNVPQDLPGLAQMLEGSREPKSIMYKVDLETFQIINSPVSQSNSSPVARNDASQPRTLVPELDGEYDDVSSVPAQVRQQSPYKISSPSITVVPRGQAPDNPSEILMHSRLPEFLERSSQDFDLVIIDTPPVLAATDAMIIGRYSDMNLMVVRQGETTTHEAEEVVRAFTNSKTRISGVILNGYDSHQGKLGKYGTQYGYQYSYT